MPAARRAGQDDRVRASALPPVPARSCRPDHRHVRAVPPPGMPGIQASSNPVNALVPRLRTQGEVLASRSATRASTRNISPPDDLGTPQRRVTTPRMSRTNSTRLTPNTSDLLARRRLSSPHADDPVLCASGPSGERLCFGVKVSPAMSHGTTLRGFLPRGWDHPVASDGTTRRVVPVVLSFSCSDAAKSSDLEAGADGVPGGQRD